LHLASLSGSWLVAVAGFGGMRDHGSTLTFAPRLPSKLSRLSFRMVYRGRRLHVDVRPEGASYELLQGEPLEIEHAGEPLTVAVGDPQVRALPPIPRRRPVEQPPGREPAMDL
jgi:alpha,alpha-trehalose phosphorylase